MSTYETSFETVAGHRPGRYVAEGYEVELRREYVLCICEHPHPPAGRAAACMKLRP
ncbi:MAG TPA: hypothetical protein VFY38_09785 [Pseudonocardia sp.]|nr:hypothetical protein [Pseudonocardia sp.]